MTGSRPLRVATVITRLDGGAGQHAALRYALVAAYSGGYAVA